MIKRMLTGVVVVLLAVVSLARGEGLIDSVPADAIFYMGWAGAGSMPAGYEQSHLKAIVDASDFGKLFSESMPRLIKLMGQEEPEGAMVLSAMSVMAEPMWKYPSAVYFGGLDMTNPRKPMPKLAVLMDAGDQAAAVAGKLQGEIAKFGPMEVPVTVTASGRVVAVVVGSLPAANGASLGGDARFTEMMGKVKADGVIRVYYDLEKTWAAIEQMPMNPREQKEWVAVRDGLNLKGIQCIAYSGSFDGKDWRDDVYVKAPSPRTGVAMLVDAKPLGAEILKVIPADASLAMAGRTDLARVMAEVRKGVAAVDARSGDEMEQGLAKINDFLEMDIERDLLEPMGDQWAVYASPNVGGDGLLGMCMVNKLDDPAKVDQALWQLSQKANEAMKGAGDGKITLEFKQFEADGINVRYFAIPFISPAWAVKDGNLYAGLYPQVVVAAAGHVNGEGKTILDNPKYQSVRKRLGDHEAGMMQFYDMEQRVPAGYASTLMFSRLYLGMADLFGGQTPAMLMPPLNVIMKHVSPAGAISWSDEQGYYMTSIEPFPGSTTLATGDLAMVGVGQQALLASIMLPSLNRSRETANRVKCASNMRQIGQATLLYCNENRQRMPGDQGILLKTQDLGVEVFLCPSSMNDIPAEARGGNVDKMAAWVNENSSYVWLAPAGISANINPETVILHEQFDNHDGDGMNLLFGDGHVEFMRMEQAEKLIEASKKDLAAMVKK